MSWKRSPLVPVLTKGLFGSTLQVSSAGLPFVEQAPEPVRAHWGELHGTFFLEEEFDKPLSQSTQRNSPPTSMATLALSGGFPWVIWARYWRLEASLVTRRTRALGKDLVLAVEGEIRMERRRKKRKALMK